MTGVVCIVAYRPKPGRQSEILELVRSRVPTLRKEGLVTDRVPVIMRAKDSTIIEVRTDREQNLALHRRVAEAALAAIPRGPAAAPPA